MDTAHDIKHRIHEAFKSTVELLTSARSTSAFLEQGVLTPDEFVEAGDNLVAKCPTWHWEGGEASRRKSYLPQDKQYLITRNVPCLQRAESMETMYPSSSEDQLVHFNGGSTPEADAQTQSAAENDDDNEAWVATHGLSGTAPHLSGHQQNRSDQGSTIDMDKGATQDADKRAEHIPDISDFPTGSTSASDVSKELDAATLSLDAATLHTGAYLVATEPEEDNSILRTRTYDLTITYDKFYQTPRIWLFGYDEHRNPLTTEQVFEDVSQDHIKRTVTMDDHPHLLGKYASVHPCRHAAVMKKIIDVMSSRGSEPQVHQYIFIFLKFLSSIIPTIEYDYTVDFSVGPRSN